MENKDNGYQKLEERVASLEQAFVQTLACLGIQLLKASDGRVGYKIPKVGKPEEWGVLAKIMSDLEKMKNEKKIVIPGRQ